MAELVPWPKIMASPADVVNWLNKLRPADKNGQRCVLTMRWLLNAELDRCAPEPPPKSITDFVPEDGPQPI